MSDTKQKIVSVVFGDRKSDDVTEEELRVMEDMIADGLEDFDYDLSGIGRIKITINQVERL